MTAFERGNANAESNRTKKQSSVPAFIVFEIQSPASVITKCYFTYLYSYTSSAYFSLYSIRVLMVKLVGDDE